MPLVEALGLFVGMIIGAGMFAMPYAVQEAGLFWSVSFFLFAAAVVTVIHLLYGFMILAHGERDEHRLPGYMGEHFGVLGYAVALGSRLFSYFGYLLAYGVLGGLLLERIIPQFSSWHFTILFFIIAAPSLLLNLKKAGQFNFFLTSFLVCFIVLLFGLLFRNLHVPTLSLLGNGKSWFLPYGIFLFAFSGASIVPEVIDMLGWQNRRRFIVTTVATTILVAVLYALFIMTILGIAHGPVGEEGLEVLRGAAGNAIFLLGVAIGFLAITTSYFTLGLELRFTFEYDLRFPEFMSWFIVAVIPLIAFLLGFNSFSSIVSLVGAIGIGIEGICIMLLARKTLKTPLLLVLGLSLCFVAGALLEIFGIFGIFA